MVFFKRGGRVKVNIITLGCKVNTYESEIIKEKFLANNYIIDEYNPDIVIVNTCSVTNNADNKSKKMIRRIRRENPKTILIVCGCASQNHQSDLADLNIDILLGTKDKTKIIEILNKYFKTKEKYQKLYELKTVEFEDMVVKKFTNQTRAFIKIQDGCNNYCSYCIIPYLRGNIRFKEFNKAFEEAEVLVENKHKEIVLTGIHTGSYPKLPELINKMTQIKDLNRIRISSIEITEINNEFLSMLKSNPKICNHLHIPLQSGSDKILKLMNRKYDKKYFIKVINDIRKIKPDISITTDVIVGFPGETENDFKDTMVFCQTLEFSKIHVFPYSLRKNTKAEQLPNHIETKIKKMRSSMLTKISDELEKNYYKKFIGKELEIIVEEVNDNISVGHTGNYLKVLVYDKLLPNEIYKIKIESLKKKIVIGVI